MGLLSRALGTERRDTLETPSQAFKDAMTGESSYSGRNVSVESSLRMVPVLAAVELRAGAIGALPLIVYRRLEPRGRERATGHWMWRLLHDQPNERMAADEVWSLVSAHLDLWGNAYLAKVKQPGSVYPVEELWPISPHRVEVGVDDSGIFYRLDGKPDKYRQADILHIRGFSVDGIRGLSRIQQARHALGKIGDREEFAGRFWGQGAVNSVVLRHPGKLSPQAHENLSRSVKRKIGAKAGGEPFVLEEGMEVDTLTMPLEDAQYIEQERMGLLEMALLFRVPPKMLGASTGDSLTYTTSEWESLDFVRWAIRPTLTRIEGSLTRDVDLFLQGRRFFPEFLIEAMLRGTSKERAEFYEKALDPKKGWMDRDEVRELENLPAAGAPRDEQPGSDQPAIDDGDPVDGEPVLDQPSVPLQIPMTVNGRKVTG